MIDLTITTKNSPEQKKRKQDTGDTHKTTDRF